MSQRSNSPLTAWRHLSGARRGHMAPKPEPARLAYVFRDGSCGSGDHPSDHDAQFGRAELVTDVPSSTFAFVL